MEYRTLGKTGLEVSALGLGTWQLGGPVSVRGKPDGFPDPGADHVRDLIHGCADLGINLIDTAPMFGLGEAERRVGRAIRDRRDRFIVATKFGLARSLREGKRPRLDAIRLQLEASLHRLRTDYVDIFQYHCPPDPGLVHKVYTELEALREAGKIRFHGISTEDPRHLGLLLRNHHTDCVMVSQSLTTHPTGCLRLAAKHDLGVLVHGSLDAGRLSDRDPTRDLELDDARREAFRSGEALHYRDFRALCPADTSMTAFALRYVLDFASTHSVVLGGRSLEQYETAAAALRLPPLDPEASSAITALRGTLTKRGLLHRALRAAKSLLD